jgi:adenine-specific DNA-methyltransferase
VALLEELIERVENEELRQSLAAEVRRLKARKKFGLVFEEHIPEFIRTPSLPIRRGVLVVQAGSRDDTLYRVKSLKAGVAKCSRVQPSDGEEETFGEDALVVVNRFGDPIYPGLRKVAAVACGDDKPHHLIIEADNYHALQLLQYTHEGRVDLIYIDPPFNTGATHWKYNNNYVDKADSWRHSKWLAFMKRRLLLAKQLLTANGILVVAIDENEHANLTLLLKELFPSCDITSVTVVHNQRGVQGDNFSYTNESALFVIPKGAKAIGDRVLSEEEREPANLRNWGGDSLRTDAANCFYPIIVEETAKSRVGKIIGFGDIPEDDFHPSSRTSEDEQGRIIVWPIDSSDVERKWRYSRSSVESIQSLLSAKKDRTGEWQIQLTKETGKYKTVWRDPKFSAGDHGTKLVRKIVGRSDFPYPKSLYTMHEILRACTENKKNAIILDYFGGSGTTLHAAMLLNDEDGGRRQCILVTSNELDPKKERSLGDKGLRPGDAEWEAEGICEAITWPRCRNVIVGKRDGKPLEGEYKSGKSIASGFDENVDYFKLEFLDPEMVELGRAFEAVFPILWIAADAIGCLFRPDDSASFLIPEVSPFAVLLDERCYREFREELCENGDHIRAIFLVTDSSDSFREMASGLAVKTKTRQLYRSYLENFRINTK